MNAEQTFSKISKEYDSDYINKTFKVPGQLCSFVFISKHILNLRYRDCAINLVYDFGNSDVANIKFEYPCNQKIPDFKLTTIDHFYKLLFFRANKVSISCESSNFKNEIISLLKQHNLSAFINKTAFEPNIEGKTENNKYSVRTKFSLNYEDHVSSIQPILEFHLGFIDVLSQKY